MKPSKVKIIAEVGSNHNGDLSTAVSYILKAKEAGADAVKFQTFKKEKLVCPYVWTHGEKRVNERYEKFANIPVPDEWHPVLKKSADTAGIELISTPFDLEAVALLRKIGVRTFKIASGDITFVPLLEAVGRACRDVILSTGASSLSEVKKAVLCLKRSGARHIVLLHCVSCYPPAWNELNLRSIPYMKKALRLDVGFSDHTPGAAAAVAAVALGACVIEKHVSLDPSQKGPDHAFAISIEKFAEMVQNIRHIEAALGEYHKKPSVTEAQIRNRFRRRPYDPRTFEPVKTKGLWLRPRSS